jgi:hypothetical protein
MEFWASVPGFAVLSTSACQLEHCGARWIWCAWEPKARSRRGVLVTGTWWLLLYSIWFIHVTLCLHKKSEIAFFMPQITCSVHRSWILPIFVVRVQWLTSTCNTNWAGGCTLNSNFQPSTNSNCSVLLHLFWLVVVAFRLFEKKRQNHPTADVPWESQHKNGWIVRFRAVSSVRIRKPLTVNHWA